jgi:hypothetical protein
MNIQSIVNNIIYKSRFGGSIYEYFYFYYNTFDSLKLFILKNNIVHLIFTLKEIRINLISKLIENNE